MFEGFAWHVFCSYFVLQKKYLLKKNTLEMADVEQATDKLSKGFFPLFFLEFDTQIL